MSQIMYEYRTALSRYDFFLRPSLFLVSLIPVPVFIISWTFLVMEVSWQWIFSVFFLKKSLCHLYFWRIYSLTIELCVASLFFLFETLKISLHHLLTCRVLDEKSTVIFIIALLYMCIFPLLWLPLDFVFDFQ